MRKILFISLFCLLSCQERSPTDISIHRYLGLPTVTVIIKGKSIEMILDTGGAVTVIDDDLARELLILPTDESMELKGYGGSRQLSLAEDVFIMLDNHRLEGDVYISDIDNISGKQIRGILGISHFPEAIIDLKNNIIKLD